MKPRPDALAKLLPSRVSGFHKAIPGRIHMRCPDCGRKQSNMTRHPEFDHPTAYMVELLCDKCGAGCKEDGGIYFTRNGREIRGDWFMR